jgi:hypothetical protein
VITASATDGAGLTGTDQISITITVFNGAPVVTITSPNDGAVINQGSPITFAATALDDFDGDLSSSLVWTSDKNGALGTGASLTLANLAKGTHTITATVTDSGGVPGSAQLRIRIKKSRNR